MKFKVLVIGLLLTACSPKPTMQEVTVAVTNLAGNSGGSGSIISHSALMSEILTNGHVCEVVKNGGFVHTSDNKRHLVKAYRKSTLHDLCVISVYEDLHHNAEIADAPPEQFEPAYVSGHPELLPTIITTGHFSDKKVIQVAIGVRECTPQELQDPSIGIYCILAGGIPVIKTYESIVVSATIQPGSSGSPVFNNEGKIAAVIFAGSGTLGYGFAVPYEYIVLFLESEFSKLAYQYPKDLVSLNDESQSSKSKLREICELFREYTGQNVCKLWR